MSTKKIINDMGGLYVVRCYYGGKKIINIFNKIKDRGFALGLRHSSIRILSTTNAQTIPASYVRRIVLTVTRPHNIPTSEPSRRGS